MALSSMIEVQGVSVPADVSELLFEGLSFGLSCGEKVGLVGRNGVGKTLLAEILAGRRVPRAGRVLRHGRVGYVPQGATPRSDGMLVDALGVGATLRALMRIYAGNECAGDLELVGDDWSLEARVRALLEELGLGYLELERPVASLSGGEAARLALGRELLKDPEFLILDEPTNHLDAEGRTAVHALVRARKLGMLIISHDRALMDVVDRILELSPKGLKAYGGNYSAYAEQKAAERAAAEARYERAMVDERAARQQMQKQREALEQKCAKGKHKKLKTGMTKMERDALKARSEKTQGRVQQHGEQAIDEAASEKRAAWGDLENLSAARMALPSCRLAEGKQVLSFEEVSYAHEGGRVLFEGLSFSIVGPRRVALAGNNGSGKTTVLRLALGELEPTRGVVSRGAVSMAYLDQRVAWLDGAKTVLEQLRACQPGLSSEASYHGLARFLFHRDGVHRRVSVLSGGERVRLGLACILLAEEVPQLLLLDEPTNHLDIASVESIEQALLDYDGAVLVVSHDVRFLESINIERTLRLGGL